MRTPNGDRCSLCGRAWSWLSRGKPGFSRRLVTMDANAVNCRSSALAAEGSIGRLCSTPAGTLTGQPRPGTQRDGEERERGEQQKGEAVARERLGRSPTRTLPVL